MHNTTNVNTLTWINRKNCTALIVLQVVHTHVKTVSDFWKSYFDENSFTAYWDVSDIKTYKWDYDWEWRPSLVKEWMNEFIPWRKVFFTDHLKIPLPGQCIQHMGLDQNVPGYWKAHLFLFFHYYYSYLNNLCNDATEFKIMSQRFTQHLCGREKVLKNFISMDNRC